MRLLLELVTGNAHVGSNVSKTILPIRNYMQTLVAMKEFYVGRGPTVAGGLLEAQLIKTWSFGTEPPAPPGQR